MTERTTERGVVNGDGNGTESGNERSPPVSRPRRRFLHHATVAGGGFALLSTGTGVAAAGGSEGGVDNDGEAAGGDGAENDEGEDDPTDVSDVDVLNFALTLEHLEANYYNQFLDEYSESEVERSEPARVFAEPGLRFSTYQKIEEVRDHEEAHVEALTQTIEDLGGDPVEPAEYDFPYETIEEFADLSATIEAVGVSAYAGAAPLIDSDEVLAAALSIHSVEARHTAYFRVLNTNTPFPKAFDPARTMEEVLEIASQFMVGEGDNGDGKDSDDDDDGDGEGNGGDGDGELSLAGLQAATGSGDESGEEYVEYLNTGDGPLDFTGWSVSNGEGVTYEFPDGFTLAPGETVRLYTGRGNDSDSALYWGKPGEVWDDRVDTMTVRDASGDVALQRSYS